MKNLFYVLLAATIVFSGASCSGPVWKIRTAPGSTADDDEDERPLSEKEFRVIEKKMEKLMTEAVELYKSNKTTQAREKLAAAQQSIFDFQGSSIQEKKLVDRFQFSIALLQGLSDPDKLTPSEYDTLIISPSEPTRGDLEVVEAARSIPSLQKYLNDLTPDSRRRIAVWINYFTKKAPARFQRYLDRSAGYRRRIHNVLADYDLPAELFYVAMIESGFSETIRSHAGAAGLWQFMPRTAVSYGLAVDSWVDERYDWIKATDAAARYLQASLERYRGNLELAVASYNTGCGNVDKAIRRAGGATDYWRLKLHRETMNYVPKWIAAMIIYNNPSRYGFHVPEDRPEKTDRINIRGSVQIASIADSIGVPVKEIQKLNPALKRNTTPPDRSWTLRLPEGCRKKLFPKLDELLEREAVVWIRHEIEENQTVDSVAMRYGVPVSRIVAANDLEDRIGSPQSGEVLMVPVNSDNEQAIRYLEQIESRWRQREKEAKRKQRTKTQSTAAIRRYKVRAGDTLWDIARRYDVSVKDLKRWNKGRIGREDRIPIGAKLTIYSGTGSFESARKYTVRKGDTLSQIAQKHRTNVQLLAQANNLAAASRIYPGMELSIPANGFASPRASAAKGGAARHTVRRGETLSEIASRYGRSVSELKQINGIQNADRIAPGRVLRLVSDVEYVVRRGDTLSAVALRYGSDPKSIAKASGIGVDSTLRVGEKLRIPGAAYAPTGSGSRKSKVKHAAGKTHIVKKGDTLWNIGKKYGVSVKALVKTNQLDNARGLRPGSSLTIPGRYKIHVVRAGESLIAISKKYGVSKAGLAKINDMKLSDTIYPGQKLTIP